MMRRAKNCKNYFGVIFASSDLHGVIRARIGSKFLKENKDLLY